MHGLSVKHDQADPMTCENINVSFTLACERIIFTIKYSAKLKGSFVNVGTLQAA